MAAAAERLAAAGFAAAAIDLYVPLGGAPAQRSQAEVDAWLERLDDARQVADLGDAWTG
jgi:dienelactone hydrolase